MRRSVVVSVAALAVAGIGGGAAVAASTRDPEPERQQEARFTEQHRAAAAVAQADAERTALVRHAGTIVETHLEDEGRGLRWEVKADDGRQVWEVQVDAATGAVVSDQLDD